MARRRRTESVVPSSTGRAKYWLWSEPSVVTLAVLNAIFAATGRPVRRLPPDNVKPV